MLGSTGGLVGSSGEGGGSAHEVGGGGGEAAAAVVVGSSSISSSIMSGGIGDEEKGRGGVGGVIGDFFEGDRSTGGNRWPRQETLALLKIRSDMDGVFRDSSLKGPLWEEVSRKMAELGFHRSSKKCKEKFENVYKYHKRTKDGRVGKSDGKTYRFFDQLEALEQHHSSSSPLPPLPPTTPRAQQSQPLAHAVPVTMVIPAGTNPGSVTVTSSAHPISVVHTSGISISTSTTPPVLHHHMNATPVVPQSQPVTAQVMHHHGQQHHHHHQPMPVHQNSPIQMENVSSPSATPSSSSSTSSDEELLGRRKRKRKWKDFFESLMKEVIDKQEQLQKRFLETVEKREHDRLVREEAWKAQEMGRLNREHEILVQERSMAAAKDAALIAFLQKLSDQQHIPLSLPVQTQTQARGAAPVQVAGTATTVIQAPTQPPPPPSQPQPQLQPISIPVSQPPQSQKPQMQVNQVHLQENPVQLAAPAPTPAPAPAPAPAVLHPQPLTQLPPQSAQQQALAMANAMNSTNNADAHKSNNGSSGDSPLQASSSRWPKAEVQALIDLRTRLDQKYQESGPKGPLWEEISSSMKKLGYNRNSKRCKEKWENINKYFKKVKESNKKRPEDSKTCPYFHQLDALYREKTIRMDISSPISPNNSNNNASSYNHPSNNPASYAPPHQSKPENLNTMGPIMAQPQQQWHPHHSQDHDMDDGGSDNDSDDDDDGEDDEDDNGSGGYEIVANNNNNNNGAGNAGVINSMSGATTATAATTTTTTATAE